jgi:hypothetical protein
MLRDPSTKLCRDTREEHCDMMSSSLSSENTLQSVGPLQISNTGTQFRRAPHYSPELHSFRKIRPGHFMWLVHKTLNDSIAEHKENLDKVQELNTDKMNSANSTNFHSMRSI